MSDERNTRERILEVAVELFTEHGYDGTSLREIAERLSITKAALYYHFPSKADILGTLADRMYERIFDFEAISDDLAVYRAPTAWANAVDALADRLLDNAKLFAMFDRNHAAMEQVAAGDRKRFKLHEENQAKLEAIMGDSSIPVDSRVRYAAAIGAVFFAATHALTVFSDTPTEELRRSLRTVVSDLVGRGAAPACDAGDPQRTTGAARRAG